MKTFNYVNELPEKYRLEPKRGIQECFKEAYNCPQITFWKPDQIERFKAVLDAMYGSNSCEVSDCPFTFFPQFDIKPVPANSRTRPEDAYGFLTLDPAQFLVRGDIKNVVSCHSAIYAQYALGGNLNYLANPFWGCVGIYSDETPAKFDIHRQIEVGVDVLNGLPNLLAACNILRGLDTSGYPCFGLSRLYGEFRIKAMYIRLIEYLNTLGRVYIIDNSALPRMADGRLLDGNDTRRGFWYNSGICTPENTKTTATYILTPPVPAQIIFRPSPQANKNVVKRYPDVGPLLLSRSEAGGVWVEEKQGASNFQGFPVLAGAEDNPYSYSTSLVSEVKVKIAQSSESSYLQEVSDSRFGICSGCQSRKRLPFAVVVGDTKGRCRDCCRGYTEYQGQLYNRQSMSQCWTDRGGIEVRPRTLQDIEIVDPLNGNLHYGSSELSESVYLLRGSAFHLIHVLKSKIKNCIVLHSAGPLTGNKQVISSPVHYTGRSHDEIARMISRQIHAIFKPYPHTLGSIIIRKGLNGKSKKYVVNENVEYSLDYAILTD